MSLTWKRVEPGYQVSTDGRYAVRADGYKPGQHVGASRDYNRHTGEGHYEGFVGGEWAAVLVATDDNLDWCPTMREAKAVCERHARTAS
jgi:hypothetical protein